MQSRRDQVQAHLFVVGRLTSGILRADPDSPEPPLTRTTRGLLIGTVLALLAGAALAIYGLIVPGGSAAWRTPDTLLIVKETGARYVYADGTLHPVPNYASAALLLGRSGATVTTTQVASAALAGVPRGEPVGIPGAPEDVPAASALGGSASWQVCAGLTGGGDPATAVLVGTGGRADPVPARQGVLVATGRGVSGGGGWLLWYGKRYRLPSDRAALAALGYAGATPRLVDAAFLDAVPAGPDLAAPPVPGRGAAGPRIGGRAGVVGQLFVLSGTTGTRQYYLLGASGLAPLTQTGYDLLLADPDTQRLAYRGGPVAALPLSATDLDGGTAAGGAAVPAGLSGLPPSPPAEVDPGATESVCLLAQPAGGSPRYGIRLADTSGLGARPVTVPAGARPSCTPAASVALGRSGGVLARDLPAAGVSGNGRTYLVTPTGTRYPLTAAAVTALGYGSVTPARLPHPLLALLPTGPTLDPDAVRAGGTAGAATGCA